MDQTLTLKKGLAIASPSTFLIICLAGLPLLRETLYSPALPAIADSLEAPIAAVQWSLAIFFIGFALGSCFWRKLSDQVGRRPAVLAGILLFTCMSFACNNAGTIIYLLIARFFQAVGASVGIIVTHAIMQDCYTASVRNKLIPRIANIIAFVPAIGLFLGGYLTQHFSWHANFICLTCVGMMVLLYAGLALPETRQVVLDDELAEIPPPIINTLKHMLGMFLPPPYLLAVLMAFCLATMHKRHLFLTIYSI